jgi:threonine synthase
MSTPANQLARPEVAQGLAQIISMYLAEQMAEPREQIKRLDSRVETIEERMARESLSRSQGRSMQRSVAKQVHKIAKDMGDGKPMHFSNVYGSLKDRYNVPSYMDIPRDKYLDAMTLIATYDGSGRNWWTD